MNQQFDLRDMLRFDKMLSPIFLTILYYIHVSGATLFWLFVISEGASRNSYIGYLGMGGGKVVLFGLFMLVVSPFLIRLIYEILIIIFRIYSRISSIDGKLGQAEMQSISNPTASEIFRQPAPAPEPFAPSNTVYPQPENMSLGNSSSNGPGFQFPFATENPVVAPVNSEPVLQDFWQPGGSVSPGTPSEGSASPVAAVNLDEVKSKMPNWPAVIAALVVIYGIISPYAQIGLNAPIIGSIQAKSYAIKDSTPGMLAVLSSLAMLVVLGGGLKWRFFLGSYLTTVFLSLVAFISDGGVFSDIDKVKSGISMATGGMGSSLGKFLPQAESISGQMANNMPGASQFLLLTFYLFLVALIFLGYWAFAGKYREKGLIQS